MPHQLVRYLKNQYKQWSKSAGFLPEPPSHALKAVTDLPGSDAARRIDQSLRRQNDPYTLAVRKHVVPTLMDSVTHAQQAQITQELLTLFTRIDPTGCHHRSVYRAAAVCFASGFYQLGGRLRDIAMHCIPTDKPKNPEHWQTAFAVALEKRDKSLLSRLLDNRPGDATTLSSGTSLLLERLGVAVPDRLAQPADLPPLWQALRGKRIALVGPVGYDVNIEDALACHDYVGRLAFNGTDGLAANTGTRADYSFYAGHKIPVQKQQQAALHQLKGVVLKRSALKLKVDGFGLPEERVVIAPSVKDLMYNCTPNAGVQFAYFLACVVGMRLTVFGFNFFLKSRYSPGYTSKGTQGESSGNPFSSKERAVSFARHHNPVAQFRFFDLLVSAGLCEPDAYTRQFSTMTLDAYLAQLDNELGCATFR